MDFRFWIRRRRKTAVWRVAEVLGIRRTAALIGDPVMLGLLDWWAAGGSDEVEFPRFDHVDGSALWETLPGNTGAVAEGLWPGFERVARERVFSAEELDVAYGVDGERVGWMRPFQRAMLRRKWGELPGGRRPVILFHHVPKCAGMSVFHHLNAHLPWNDELCHLDARAEKDVLAAGVTPFEWKDPREVARVRVLFGHDVAERHANFFPGREVRRVTCLRDPAERMVSHYNWEMNQRELTGERMAEFEEWYGWQEKNWMTRWFGRVWLGLRVNELDDEEILARVSEALAGFWIVGGTRNLTENLRPMTQSLELPEIGLATNRAGESYPKRMRLDERWRNQISAEHGMDAKLVRWRGREF